MTKKSKALKGYSARDKVSHRKYSRKTSIARYKKTKKFTYRGKGALKGSGHRAGEDWANRKGIDPHSRVTRYGKNSPSFDEGVWKYKQGAKSRALTNFKKDESQS